MAIPSKFDDHKCGQCGVLIKKGDQVNKIDATGKWCSNPNCPNPPVTDTTTTPTSSTREESQGYEPKPAEALLRSRWKISWNYANTVMKEIYPETERPPNFKKDTLILAQCFFKGLMGAS